MGNNFNKMMILHKGKYYQIDRKPEFHQEACRHKFIKAQIIMTVGDMAKKAEKDLEEKGYTGLGQEIAKLRKQEGLDKIPVGDLMAGMLGRRPKSVNLCRKCGKVKKRNN